MLKIYENDNFIICHGPFESQVLGYLYIEPKRHLENWDDFFDQELSEIAVFIKKADRVLKQLLSIERMYVVTISESVRHIHVHLIPRLPGQMNVGLGLIEQATQKKNIEGNNYSDDDFNHFIENARVLFNEI